VEFMVITSDFAEMTVVCGVYVRLWFSNQSRI